MVLKSESEMALGLFRKKEAKERKGGMDLQEWKFQYFTLRKKINCLTGVIARDPYL